MKKTVAIILAVLMVISNLTCAFTVSAATTNSVGEYFENPDNWVIYNSSATSLSQTDLILENKPDSWPGICTKSDAYVLEGDKALRLRTKTKFAAVYLPSDLKANTEYTLSFSYFYDATADTTAFNPIALCTTDVENASFVYNKPGPLYFKANNYSFTSTDGVTKENETYPPTGGNLLATTAGEWHKVEIKFNTGDLKELALVLKTATEYLRLDDFALTEKIVTNEEYFNNPKNWIMDTESTTFVGSTTPSSWAYINNSSVTVGDKTVNAIKLHSLNNRSSIYLPNLKKNTEYTFSFKYYAESLSSAGYVFKDMVLFNSDFENAKIAWNYTTPNGVKEYVSFNGYYIWDNTYSSATTNWDVSFTTKTAKAGEWNTYSVTFNTGDYNKYATVLLPKVEDVYLCDFALNEKVITPAEHFNNPENWTLFDESAKTLDTPLTSTWATISNAPVTVGSVTTPNALKVHALNHRVASYLPNLKKNTEYTFSFKYYAETKNTANYIFQDMVLFTPDFSNAQINWSTGTANGVKEFVSYNGYYLWNDDYSKAATNWDDSKKTISAKAGVWNTHTVTFNTGDYENYAIVLLAKVENIYLKDFKLFDTSNPPEEPEEPEEQVPLDFEDASQWERYSSSAINTSSGQAQNTWHVVSANTTETDFIKEGDTSIKITPQSQFNMIKLGGLEPNTKYMLKFSYITDSMKNTEGATKKTIFSGCGIWNYKYKDAKFAIHHVENHGYIHASKMSGDYFEVFFDSKGERTLDYFARKISNQQANVWYNKVLYFDSADVSDSLSFVLSLEVANVYLDDFMLVALDESEEATDYAAPALSGKNSSGSYKSYKNNNILYKEVTLEDYEGYLATLAGEGFTEYAVNAYGDDKFAIYTKGNTAINVNYAPHTNTILVSHLANDVLPTLAKDNVYTDKGYEPAIIQIDHNCTTNGGTGMSYVVRLADGSFIVVDGGMTASFENTDKIYNALKTYSSEKPVIAAWLVTHGHEDHISAITSFVEKYYEEVVVEQMIFNLPTLEQCASSKSPIDHKMVSDGIAPMLLSIQALMPDTKVSTCHTGYKYNIRNAVVDVMFTLDDLFPTVFGASYNDHNGVCSVFKIAFTNETIDQSLLITGDANGSEVKKMLEKYPDDELKATFVQANHHSMNAGTGSTETYDFYAKVQPEVVLIPTADSILTDYLYQPQNQYFVDVDSVKEVIVSDYGTRALVLPYTAPEGLTGLDKFTIPADLSSVSALNSYKGVSIRRAGTTKQALRFKFQIPEHIVRAQTEDGYTVAEYGMMVSEANANLNYYEGKKAYTTVDGNKVFKGVAYNKADNKNVVFDYVNYKNFTDDENRSIQYTCALYNIGVGSDNTTDYSKYDTTYYVRSYIVFKNANGDTKVYYGATQSASVFAVMQTILKSTATDDQTTSDKVYVKNFLDGKVSGFEADAAAIKGAWIKDSTRASIYTPNNN